MYYTLMYNLYICIDQLKEKAMKSPFQYGTMVDKDTKRWKERCAPFGRNNNTPPTVSTEANGT